MGAMRVSLYIKLISILLTASLLLSGMEPVPTSDAEVKLRFLVTKFQEKQYSQVISESEKMLTELGEENLRVRGKFFLLLGAAYEKSKNKDEAVENYLLGDMLLDKPVLKGIDFNKMEIYQSTFHGKIIGGRRVYEKVGKRKRKKRFPYLAIAGAAAIVIAVLILFKKKKLDQPKDLSGQYAREIMSEIEWVEIPAGEFLMGDHTGAGEPHERPVHRIYLDRYRISKHEITFNQYGRFAEVNLTFISGFYGRGDNYPVTSISINEAEEFCKWMSEETGTVIIVPTEAQWEKAARGTDQRIYPWGNESPNCSRVNYNQCNGGTSEIGSFSADISFYGVLDMGGNVAEWVSDGYVEDYYSISPYSNPSGPEYRDTDYRILRGGNWIDSTCRAAERNLMGRWRSSSASGFRIVQR